MAKSRVLVVDDERLSRQQVIKLLEDRDLLVETAASGEAAVRKVEQGEYDIVFLNLVLPRMDGHETLDRMLSARPDLSVVVVTPSGNLESSAQALKRGGYHSLAKPLDGPTLDVVVRNCLERAQLLRRNASLQQQALLDDQTAAYNRRFMDTYLEEELERARRYRRPFSLLFFDLDHLKDVNDRHGHLCGSRALREVSCLVQQKLRKSDKMFRFGGDEFVVALPETDGQGAYRVAQRIRRAMKGYRFLAAEGFEVTLTASFGIATYPQHGKTREALLRRADAAMYRVKATTRDAVGPVEEP